ncbi:DUF2157 domain-containing protein [Propionivibrio sp.]|uniref:DUF2157 domain-containing protein n=1 Tax=Propionivibrio sp. TaxID=2212460 RepID=UPI00272E89CF|nr:DUF2157 domain-containing protein [Propionivibrio sp.]
MTLLSRTTAQRRADQIQHFRRELQQLAEEGVLQLNGEQRQRLDVHHEALLAEFAGAFDIDRDARSRQLSWGMRIASLLGALALAASVFFLFRQFWGLFSEWTQVGILAGASLATFGATLITRQRDATGYFTKLCAMVAFACFVLNVAMIGQIFNITPSDKALLPWAVYGLLLAYLCDLRLLLAAGLVCLLAFVAARVGTWSGVYWVHFGERPENFFPAALALFALPMFFRHERHDQFPAVYRLAGLLAFFLPVLILSHWGAGSYLAWPATAIEHVYQIAGFVFGALTIWLGLRRQWTETANAGVVFFVIFLYTKFYDWWWELMPKYLFFLVLGLTAVLVLLVMKRLRRPATLADGESS